MRGPRGQVATAWSIASQLPAGWALSCAIALGTLGCGDAGTDDAAGTADAGGSAAPDGSAGPFSNVAWEACRAAGDSIDALCTTLPMPLFHDDPQGESIDFFIKRLPAPGEPQLQLWLLQGGPGNSGESLEYLGQQIQQVLPDVEVLVPDHRGTGQSSFFECTDTFSEYWQGQLSFSEYVENCPAELADIWGSGTEAFTATQAAWDVAEAIAALRRSGVAVAAYGGSYGGYWLHRVMQVSDQVDSAIFDSSLRPNGRLSEADFMVAPDAAGQALLGYCATNAECNDRLEQDPITNAARAMDNGYRCTALLDAGFDRGLLQEALSRALENPAYRRLVPAVLYRLARCEDADVDFILGFRRSVLDSVQAPAGDPGEETQGYSIPVNFNIAEIEIKSEPVSVRDLLIQGEMVVFANPRRSVSIMNLTQNWPAYPLDEWPGHWMDSEANVLILHGDLDAVAPLDWSVEFAEAIDAPNHHFVEVHGGGHGVVYYSQQDDDGVTCGAQIIYDFLTDPSERPNTDCAEVAPSFEVGASDEILMDIAGHTDPWDNP